MTRTTVRMSLLLFPLLIASGCASLSKEECARGDWFEIGRQDGAAGHTAERISKHGKACEEYGVAPNQALYSKGRAEGLKSYCEPSNGLRLGKEGRHYEHVCPSNLEAAFLKKYQLGKKIYDLNHEVSRTYSSISDLQNKLETEKDDWRRRRIREDINDLNYRRDNLQRQLTVLELQEMQS